MSANLKTQQWPQDGKRSVFIPISKKGNVKEYSNYHIIALISHTSKVMLKITFKLGFNSTWTKNFQMYKLDLEKAEETSNCQHLISSVQSLSHVWLFVTPWIAARQASLSNTNSLRSLILMSIELVMPSSHLILCRPLLLLPPNPSQHHSFFQWVNSLHEVAKVLEFQL